MKLIEQIKTDVKDVMTMFVTGLILIALGGSLELVTGAMIVMIPFLVIDRHRRK